MPRRADPTIKEDLIARALEYFETAPLSSLSFRKLAEALGVSTYALVYHFGTRDELLAELVRAIAERQKGAEATVESTTDRLERHLAAVKASFEWTLDPENRRLQRLEFEAAMVEALDPEAHTATRHTFAYWMEVTEAELTALGIDAETAATEARILNNFFYGFQYDLVVNSDVDAIVRAFNATFGRYGAFLRRIVAEAEARNSS